MSADHLLIDDHLLLRVLLADEPPSLRTRGARLSTTGLWYHRLCRAVAVPTVQGVLSRALGGADPALGALAIEAVTELPETVGLVSLRDLSWPMANLLGDAVRLNLLSLEALAAAEHLGAAICLATGDDNPSLVEAARARGVEVRLVGD